MNTLLPFLLGTCLLAISACSPPHEQALMTPEDSLRIVDDNIRHRAMMDTFFRDAPESPFKRDTTRHFRGAQWFPIDPRFCVSALLQKFAHPDTVSILGTRGELRRQVRYGYFEIYVPDERGIATPLKLHVYKFTPQDSLRYARYPDHLSVWFTDRTTGKETYHVGRYLEIGRELPDPLHRYILDLNKAYNPYCAYSDTYSCAVPSEDDRLDFALRVGERKYHH